ncbi:LysM peptidoglycan-binding domain-containing protein [Phocicoccus pinnipedialis]|uniref:Cell division suppressor protein YneA n=1 Tax=Phocicoccus pinnipedialis TaxID=110845 RepID=A0A6V7R1C1_9BACL|nr:LysM peptidoglycan-binding domain-containing protein [Jeotgalicoccus pinnipedialis]CAD2070813.1 Cell division suppressor protein YneA [Jeotgalicoccus pinnipedialis]
MKKTVVSVATLTALAGTSVANIQAQEVTVKSGDSLWGIANAVGTTVADLKSANNLSSNLIHPGDVLSYSQSFTNNNANTYTVKAGDTLWAIGNEYGVSYKVIMEANNLKTDLILPGQTLKLNVDKVEEVSAPKVAIESIDATKVEKTQSATDAYVIQSGDTLYKISRETGVELNTLKAVNGLKSDLIFPGQVLVLKGEVETPVVEQVVTEEAKVVEHTPVVEEVTEVVTEEAEVVEHTPVVEEVTEVVTEEAEVVEHTPVVEETSETVEDVSAAQKAEADRQAAIKAEQQRIAAQKAEADRQAAIKAEQQRIAAQKAEADRQAAIKAEQQRVAAQKAEADRQAAIKAEQQRVAAQKAEADRQASIKAEQQRVAAQKAEAQRQA